MSKKNNSSKEKQNKKIGILVVLVIVLIALIGIFGFFLMKNNEKEEKNTLAYTELIKELSYGNIE